LTSATETIIAEDSRVPLGRHIVELEEDKNTLQHTLDHSIKDYNLLVMGNKSLLSERNELKCRCQDLHVALVEAHSNAKKTAADLDVKVKTMKAQGEKCLRDLEDGLVRKIEELCGLFVGNVQTMGAYARRWSRRSPWLKASSPWPAMELSSLAMAAFHGELQLSPI
jgi:hypothetical protein